MEYQLLGDYICASTKNIKGLEKLFRVWKHFVSRAKQVVSARETKQLVFLYPYDFHFEELYLIKDFEMRIIIW